MIIFIPIDNLDDLELSVGQRRRVRRRDGARPIVGNVDDDDLPATV
jgi:hypothetical protein